MNPDFVVANIPPLLNMFKANMMLNFIPDKYLTVDTVTALNAAKLKVLLQYFSEQNISFVATCSHPKVANHLISVYFKVHTSVFF